MKGSYAAAIMNTLPAAVVAFRTAGLVLLTFVCAPASCLFLATPVSAAPDTVSANAILKRGGSACLSDREVQLIRLVNRYRERSGLPPVPVSRSLVKVARLHAFDLQDNKPDQGEDARGLACNMHSWSSRGPWTAGCYTNDHRAADLMRGKPRELTASLYDEVGYEAVYRISVPPVSPLQVLDSWLKSDEHRALLLETGKWAGIDFKAIGVGFTDNYAVIWFGPLRDPLGSLLPCSAAQR